MEEEEQVLQVAVATASPDCRLLQQNPRGPHPRDAQRRRKYYSMCPYEFRHVLNPKVQHLTESHVSQCQPRLLLAVGSWHLEAPPAW